jgi:hypothetical protein
MVVFSQDMSCVHLATGRNYFEDMNVADIEFFWRQSDELPSIGTIVVIAHDKESLRWAYLPENATREEIESAFSRGYRWFGPAVCRATIMADGKVIDQWRFTVEPFVHELT